MGDGDSKRSRVDEEALVERLSSTISYYRKQVHLLSGALAVGHRSQVSRVRQLQRLLIALSRTANAIEVLSSRGFVNEVYMIARAFVERSVNYCLILVADDALVQDFIDYSIQKEYRSLNRQLETANHRIRVKAVGFDHIEAGPSLRNALQKYTTKKSGKEVRKWTQLSVPERVETIKAAVRDFEPLTMLTAYFAVNEKASEALHGTLHGALVEYDLASLSSELATEPHLQYLAYSNLQLILFLLANCIHELLKVLGEREDLGQVYSESYQNYTAVLAEDWARELRNQKRR
jgi:hypothetical protein